MRDQFRPIATNLTPVNVVGIPGLMLSLIAIALAFQFPEARWLIASGLAGGACIAFLLIKLRQRRSSDDDDRWSPGVMHIYDPVATAKESGSPRRHVRSPHHLVPSGI